MKTKENKTRKVLNMLRWFAIVCLVVYGFAIIIKGHSFSLTVTGFLFVITGTLLIPATANVASTYNQDLPWNKILPYTALGLFIILSLITDTEKINAVLGTDSNTKEVYVANDNAKPDTTSDSTTDQKKEETTQESPSSIQQNETSKTDTVLEPEVQEPTKEETNTTTNSNTTDQPSSSTVSQKTYTIDDFKNYVTSVVSEHFKNYEVQLSDEKDMVIVNTWTDGLTMDLMLGKDDESIIQSWENIKESINNSSLNLSNIAKNEFKLDNVHVTLNILNDLNKDNVLLTSFNGIILYDVLEDLD